MLRVQHCDHNDRAQKGQPTIMQIEDEKFLNLARLAMQEAGYGGDVHVYLVRLERLLRRDQPDVAAQLKELLRQYPVCGSPLRRHARVLAECA